MAEMMNQGTWKKMRDEVVETLTARRTKFVSARELRNKLQTQLEEQNGKLDDAKSELDRASELLDSLDNVGKGSGWTI